MSVEAAAVVPERASGGTKLAVLLAMAMFVLVFDTSLMNVSISAVVKDLHTTASGVQSAIALEALVSAAFILIGSKIGDLIGRKRAYIVGLLGYAVGALAMTLAQSLLPIIICWAIIGGLGASLLLPAMQSLVHGNFEGPMQRKAYALVGASAAIAAAVGPLLGGLITTYLSWRVGFLGELVIIGIVLLGMRLVHDVPYTGSRKVDVVGAILSAVGMGGIVLGILVWEDGGGAVGALMGAGAVALVSLGWWLTRRKRQGKAALIDPGLFKSKYFRLGISSQTLQQIALGGLMIALPLFLQMVLEYNALEAGLSIAPLSLSMFAVALIAGKRAGKRSPSKIILIGFVLLSIGVGILIPIVPHADTGWDLFGPLLVAGAGLGPPRLPAEQLHAGPDRGGARQRGGRRELGRRLVRALVRPGLRRRDHARVAVAHLHEQGQLERGALAGRAGPRRRRPRRERRGDDERPSREPARRVSPRTSRPRSSASTPRRGRSRCRSRFIVPLVAGLLGLINGFRMTRLPDIKPSEAAEATLVG